MTFLDDATRRVLYAAFAFSENSLAFECGIKHMIPRNDRLFGTWVNAKYDVDQRSVTAKFTIKPDGHELDYRHIADATPYGECWDTLEKKWIDAEGRQFYRLRVVKWCGGSSSGSWEGFCLAKTSPDGSTIKTVFAEYGYPQDVGPLGPCYSAAYRQK